MLSQTFVLGVLFLIGVQSQFWDLRPLESREETSPFSIWPFYPLNLYTPQPWWKGPNVCVERHEVKKDLKNETKEDVELLDDVTHVFQASLSFSHCFETPNKYECLTKLHVQGEDKTYSTKYKCCHGYSRSRLSGECVKQADLKPLLDVIERLNGTNFRRLVSSLGFEERLTSGNYTVFMPVDNALHEATDEISEMNKVEVFRKRRDIQDGPTSELVLNHVVPGFIDLNEYDNEDIIYSENGNSSIRLNFYPTPKSGKLATANCAKITKANSFATNGIVHVVDGLIQAPMVSLNDVIQQNERLTFLKAALRNINLDDVLTEEGHVTFFAPTDDAFSKVNNDIRQSLEMGRPCAKNILRYLITPHTVCSAAVVQNATVHNVDGELLSLERRDGDEVFIDSKAKIVESDIITTNGVLHLIDTVLIPSSALPVDKVLTRNNVTKFLNLIRQAGLEEEFDSLDNATVFVPFNEAFEEPDSAKYLEEIQGDQGKLRDLVLYHTVNGKYESGDMERSRLLQTKYEGKPLRLKANSIYGGLFPRPLTPPLIQCAVLTKFEEKTCGSVVHEIDRLLIPPTKTLLQMLDGDKKYSTFRSLLEGTELEEKLKDQSLNLTVLAPNNYAFGRFRYDLDVLRGNKTLANTVLRKHVLGRPKCCQELNYSENIFNRWSPFNDPFQPVNARMITECDKIATNGILHTVNTFMYRHE